MADHLYLQSCLQFGTRSINTDEQPPVLDTLHPSLWSIFHIGELERGSDPQSSRQEFLRPAGECQLWVSRQLIGTDGSTEDTIIDSKNNSFCDSGVHESSPAESIDDNLPIDDTKDIICPPVSFMSLGERFLAQECLLDIPSSAVDIRDTTLDFNNDSVSTTGRSSNSKSLDHAKEMSQKNDAIETIKNNSLTNNSKVSAKYPSDALMTSKEEPENTETSPSSSSPETQIEGTKPQVKLDDTSTSDGSDVAAAKPNAMTSGTASDSVHPANLSSCDYASTSEDASMTPYTSSRLTPRQNSHSISSDLGLEKEYYVLVVDCKKFEPFD